MAGNDSDDPSFDDEMARMGVVPLDRVRQDKARARGRKERDQKRDKTKGREPEPGQSKTGKDKATTSETRAPANDAAAEMAAELARTRRELVASHEARAELEHERQGWTKERAELEERFARERADERARVQKERATYERRQGDLRRELARVQEILDGHRSLFDILQARGCADESEAITVLQHLLDVRPRDVLDAVQVVEPAALVRLLEDRVAFVGESVEFDPGPDCVVIRVPPERCEITGGSDIRAAFHRLREACKRASVERLTIVGGSPAYRRQLQELTRRHGEGLNIKPVPGDKRRERRRAEADMRASDLVVIWGATELDHSVSAVYTGAPEKTVYAAHRGISRMLLQVADGLDEKNQG